MGITAGTIRLLAQTVKKRGISGNVVTLGVQGVQAKYDELVHYLNAEDFEYKRISNNQIVIDNITQWKNTIHQGVLFKMLGFTNVESLDYFSDEKPTHIVDLNQPVLESLVNRYDLIYDGGTMEHCFDVRSVLANCVRMLKVGGVITHHVPMSGSIDHGFYQFSPTLFFDFYGENGFDEMNLKIHFMDGHDEYYIEHEYGKEKRLPNWFDYGSRYIFFTAKKRMAVSEIKIPIQNKYREIFGDKRNQGQVGHVKAKMKLHRKILKMLFPKKYDYIMEYEHFLLNRRRTKRRISKLKKSSIALT